MLRVSESFAMGVRLLIRADVIFMNLDFEYGWRGWQFWFGGKRVAQISDCCRMMLIVGVDAARGLGFILRSGFRIQVVSWKHV